jgi:acyl transferase domain-containing protein/ubiquinone/menaquinone biosynthesis C-methylase UbiE
VTGHSSGEVAAAYAAGGIDLRSAMAIVYIRGALATTSIDRLVEQKNTVSGGMAALGLGREEANAYISQLKAGRVVVACVNSPVSVTVSGDLPAIVELETMLQSKGISARRLLVKVAYHSHHMQPIASGYKDALEKSLTGEGDFEDVVYTSPTTGGRIHSAKDLTPEHWTKNMLQPVEFLSSLTRMCVETVSEERALDILIEVGPHSALAGPIRQVLQTPELKDLNLLYGSCLVRKVDAVQSMQTLVCLLLARGYPVDLGAVNFPNGQEELEVLCDLPSYPWNHQVKHWLEPRINSAHRTRKHPTHDLLGSFALGTNPLVPRWRHIIRASDIPWVRDHLVQSTIVYPGAGYISMAIEAIQQIPQAEERIIAGYRLRNIDIMKALIVPDNLRGVEVELSFRDCGEDKLLGAKGWQEFHIHSIADDGSWVVHCKGFIALDFDSLMDETTSWSGLAKGPAVKEQFGLQKYTKDINPSDIYRSMQAVGIHHGPAFRNLESIEWCQSQSVSTFYIAETAPLMPCGHESTHVLHPTTLDSIFQAAYSTLPGAGSRQSSAMVPKTIKAMYVSNTTRSHPGQRFQAYSTLHQSSLQGFQATIVTTADGDHNSTPIIEVHDLFCQSLGDALAHQSQPNSGKPCSAMHWSEDLPLLAAADLKEPMKFIAVPDEIGLLQDMKLASYLYIHEALEMLTVEDVEKLLPHHLIFYNWMQRQRKRANLNLLSPRSAGWHMLGWQERQVLFDKVGRSSVNGEMVCRIGTNLVPILLQETAPLELMSEDKLLYRYYEQALRMPRNYLQVKRLVKLVAHKNPQATVLEIGGGTGGCTRSVLEALSGDGSMSSVRFASYTFTDISSGFFETAREKFGAWGDLISYKKLDIESNPEEQGFECHSYDLIIACQVLHATAAMDKTMINVRKLLKPGGTLVMVETTRDALDISIIFGTLPGWWLSMSPLYLYGHELIT